MKNKTSKLVMSMLITSFIMPNIADARINGRRSAGNGNDRIKGNVLSTTTKESTTQGKLPKKDFIHIGQYSPYTGIFFKFSEFSFVEEKSYKFSDFMKIEEGNRDIPIDFLMYDCGVVLNIQGKQDNAYIGPMEPYDSLGNATFEQRSLKKEDLVNTYISFRKGSADSCNKIIPEARSIGLGYNGKTDKLTFTIKKKDEQDGQVVKVSKSVFDKVKNDCSKIDMKSLLTVKNLMISSAVVSGIGTAAGIAGTTMGALSIVNNKKEGNEKLNKQLDIGQTVTSAIGTATSATSLTTSAISADKVKKLIQDIEDCKNSASRLGVVTD